MVEIKVQLINRYILTIATEFCLIDSQFTASGKNRGIAGLRSNHGQII